MTLTQGYGMTRQIGQMVTDGPVAVLEARAAAGRVHQPGTGGEEV
jgi:hypothetical protein